jgi:transcriptional regulator with XRE-family HTH domain
MTRVADPYVEWLKAGLKRAGKSQSELARAMGLDPSIVNKIVNGKRTLKAPEIPIVAAFLGERPPALGPAQADNDGPSDTSEIFPVTSLGLVEAPVIGTVEAGSFREVYAMDDLEPEMVVVPPDPRFPNARLLVFHVAGDSMNDLRPRPILPGDRIVTVAYEDVAHEVPLRDGMTVVVQRTRDGGHMREWSVKQLELYDDHVEFCPRSTNPRHRPIRVPRDAFADGGTEVEIIAVVRQVMNTIPL